MEDLLKGFSTPNLFRMNSRGSENDAEFQRRRDFPRHSYSTPVNARPELATISSPFVSGYAASPTKRVYLYKWFLIRPVGNDPENDINHNGVQVALGGYATSDLLDKEKFTTAPIESRIEKCELRTVDGLNIRLMGAIDEQCTYNNGFPFQVIHLFLTGFPFNWNHALNMYFGHLRLSGSVLSASKAEENAGQQKYEALNSEHIGKQIEGVGTGKLSFQEPRENMSNVTSRESSAECSKRRTYGMEPSVLSTGKGEDNTGHETDEVLNSKLVGKQVESVEAGKLSFQELRENMPKAEKNMLNVTSLGKSSQKCSKRGRCNIEPIRSSKRLKHDRSNMNSEPGTPYPLVDSREDSNVLRESASYLSSPFCTESVKKEVKTPEPKFSDVETHEQAHMDDNLMVTGHNTGKDSVKGKKNLSNSVISQSIKGNRLAKNQIDANKLTDSVQTANRASVSEIQTNNHSPSAEDGAKQGFVNKETEQSSTANVRLEQLENKCTSAGEQTPDGEEGCLGKSGDKEEGCLHARRSNLENSGQNSANKSYNLKKLIPIPPRRVKTTTEEVSKAFGLKTSRSGRLIVPPLAHWCNQTIAYDLDGGIIAIFDGSSERETNESAFKFKPPQEKDAVKIRRKLYNAANEIIRTPSSVKKKGKH